MATRSMHFRCPQEQANGLSDLPAHWPGGVLMTGEVVATSDTREGAEALKRQYRDLMVKRGHQGICEAAADLRRPYVGAIRRETR